MDNLVGQYIGRYHVIEQLGQGGMASVYKAFDTRLERNVAIKVIRKDIINQSEATQMLLRFEREAKALAKLDHPNIVKIHDYGEHEGAPYLVMQYLPGGTLKDKIGRQITYNEAARLLIPVCRALDYAHKQGILHRDVKPANILITEGGDPMLSDFGIAKILETEPGAVITRAGVGIGTPEYMAPEQGMAQPIDHRADIYSMGVIFYELITGIKPYMADTPMAVVVKHINDPLPRPKFYNPNLPDLVEQIIFRAMAKRPAERFQSMAELANTFEQLTAQPAAPAQQQPSLEFDETVTRTGPVQMGSGSLPPMQVNIQERQTGFGRAYTPPPSAPPVVQKKGGLPRWLLFGGIGIIILGCLAVAVLAVAYSSLTGESISEISFGLNTRTFTPSPTPSDTPTPKWSPTPTSTQTPLPSPTPTITPTLGIGSSMISEIDNMKLLYVPEGEFPMGANDYSEDEMPLHNIYLDAFWIDQTEVTISQYAAFLNAVSGDITIEDGELVYYRGELVYDLICTKCTAWEDRMFLDSNGVYQAASGYGNHPTALVSWYGANAYCEWAGRRLPSEAEWEKAARGSEGLIYPWGNTFDSNLVNLDDETSKDEDVITCTGSCDGYDRTSPVGSFPQGASPYGALDMAGNLWEWVADWYAEDYYYSSPAQNPLGPDSGSNKVIRGSGWGNLENTARTANRSYDEPDDKSTSMGFRCAK